MVLTSFAFFLKSMIKCKRTGKQSCTLVAVNQKVNNFHLDSDLCLIYLATLPAGSSSVWGLWIQSLRPLLFFAEAVEQLK